VSALFHLTLAPPYTWLPDPEAWHAPLGRYIVTCMQLLRNGVGASTLRGRRLCLQLLLLNLWERERGVVV